MFVFWIARRSATADWAPIALGLYRKWSGRAVGELRHAPNGRPIADGAYISVSHTDGMSAIALADVPVGIDVERKDRPISQALGAIADWTRKEAYAKMQGSGLTGQIVRGDVPIAPYAELDVSAEHVATVCCADTVRWVYRVPEDLPSIGSGNAYADVGIRDKR